MFESERLGVDNDLSSHGLLLGLSDGGISLEGTSSDLTVLLETWFLRNSNGRNEYMRNSRSYVLHTDFLELRKRIEPGLGHLEIGVSFVLDTESHQNHFSMSADG